MRDPEHVSLAHSAGQASVGPGIAFRAETSSLRMAAWCGIGCPCVRKCEEEIIANDLAACSVIRASGPVFVQVSRPS